VVVRLDSTADFVHGFEGVSLDNEGAGACQCLLLQAGAQVGVLNALEIPIVGESNNAADDFGAGESEGNRPVNLAITHK
jgi:hypothetical protein